MCAEVSLPVVPTWISHFQKFFSGSYAVNVNCILLLEMQKQ